MSYKFNPFTGSFDDAGAVAAPSVTTDSLTFPFSWNTNTVSSESQAIELRRVGNVVTAYIPGRNFRPNVGVQEVSHSVNIPAGWVPINDFGVWGQVTNTTYTALTPVYVSIDGSGATYRFKMETRNNSVTLPSGGEIYMNPLTITWIVA